MPVQRIVSILVNVTLIQLMVTIGLGVTLRQVAAVAANGRLVATAAIANYLLVPACAAALLLLFKAPPLVSAGLLITAVCPGAPYGPPFTALAKGDVAVSVGLMALLAASSAVVSPLLLKAALPIVANDQAVTIDVLQMDGTLIVTQLLPLAAGVAIGAWRPELADRLAGPSKRVSLILNLATVGLIVVVQHKLLLDIRPMAYAGMLALTLASVGAGWALGGGCAGRRVAMAFSTGVRNVGVSLVIATASFPGTAAVTAALAYALFQTFVLAALAFVWGRLAGRDVNSRTAS
ncbi:bile acid:sodium symporter family protein [Rhodoblastus sp.]|uniref:bile acid:sodium symporter family protein n=1 Tax=Rhodoblastus sp. TaxID=1962975 RepID=UPI0035B0E555